MQLRTWIFFSARVFDVYFFSEMDYVFSIWIIFDKTVPSVGIFVWIMVFSELHAAKDMDFFFLFGFLDNHLFFLKMDYF